MNKCEISFVLICLVGAFISIESNPVTDALNTSKPEFPAVMSNNPSTSLTQLPSNSTEKKPITTSATSKPTTEADPPPKPTTSTTSTTSTTPTTPTMPTTSKPTSSTTTTVPPITTPAPSKHDRSFDVMSFIGGMILALGLTAIGYVIFKFYKTRTDPNYRTI